MKVIRKIAYGLMVLCALLGVLFMFGIYSSSDEFVRVFNDADVPSSGDICGVIAVVGGVIVFTFLASLLWYLLYRIVKPLESAVEFTDRLAAGEVPPPPSIQPGVQDEILLLIQNLGLLRDRQLNLTNKLKLSVAREAEIRREIERHDTLQLRIISRLLPEMRYPLNAIKGFALIGCETMDKTPETSPELRHWYEEIIRRVGVLSRQIERMCDIGSLVRDRWSSSQISEFRTTEFMRELMEINTLALEAREVTLINHFSASAPEFLSLDRELLLQLLTILIRAVGRASAIGETVTLSCFKEHNHVIFEIKDNRSGICREELAKFYNDCEADFDPSMSLDSISINVLGLFFVRDIAAKCGSRLEVASTPQSCTVLRLVFDAKDCVGDSGEHRSENWRSSASRQAWSEENSEQSHRSVKVLLEDEWGDDKVIIPRLLQSEQIEVICAANTAEAEKLLAQEEFDAVLVSEFSERDPLEKIERLRGVAHKPELPFVVLARQFNTSRFRRSEEQEKISWMVYPLNYALLGKLLHRYGGRSARE